MLSHNNTDIEHRSDDSSETIGEQENPSEGKNEWVKHEQQWAVCILYREAKVRLKNILVIRSTGKLCRKVFILEQP